MTDVSWITRNIAVGSAPLASDVPALVRIGITDVLDLRGEPNAGEAGPYGAQYYGTPIQYHYDPMRDNGSTEPTSVYRDGTQVIFDALASNPNARVLIHCFPPGTMIDGAVPRPIESIAGHRGEMVTAHDGSRDFVSAVMRRKFSGNLVVINATGTLPIKCTPEHPVLILRPYRVPSGKAYNPHWKISKRNSFSAKYYEDAFPQWVKAKDIQAGDFLLTPGTPWNWPSDCSKGDEKFPFVSAHKNSRTKIRSLPNTSDVAWMLGLYAADGSTMGEFVIGFCLSPKDDLPRLKRAIRSLGLKPNVRDYGTYVRVTVNSKTIAKSFKRWFGSTSSTKRLPAFIFNNGWDIGAVLDGLIEGDGTSNKGNGFVIDSTSLVLALQARNMMLIVGKSPTIRLRKRFSGFKNAAPIYSVSYKETSKNAHTFRWKSYHAMPVIDVSAEKYSGPVHNFETVRTHTYVANGIAVHNCAAGQYRSPSMAYAYLRLAGMPPADAWDAVMAGRPQSHTQYRADAERAVQSILAAGGVHASPETVSTALGVSTSAATTFLTLFVLFGAAYLIVNRKRFSLPVPRRYALRSR